MKKVLLLIVVFLSMLIFVGCKSTKVTLSSISVDSSNAKTTYEFDETFSHTGLVVTAKYSNNSEKVVTGFTVDSSKYVATTAGSYEITINYSDGGKSASVSYQVTVKAKVSTVVLSSITLNTTNVKTAYVLEEAFLSTGLVVTAHYSDSTSKAVTGFIVNASTYQTNTVGTYVITVTYTEATITKTATFNVTVVEPVMTGLKIKTESATTIYVLGDDFSAEGIALSILYSDASEAAYAEDDFVVDSSAYKKDSIGKYTIVITLTIGETQLTGSYIVEVVTNVVTIKTVQDFLDMRVFVNTEGYNSKIYTLANDIDLQDVVLDPATCIFSGSFDGGGFTIKNASFTQTASKQGLMFSKIDGSIVKNVRFFACTVIGGANETVAIIAGECNNTGATFENIEFSCCTVDNGTQNYAALIIGRNESKTVNLVFNNITVKNLTSVSSKQYVGGLIGDVIKGTTITVENCDIDVSLNSSNNISVFSGRNRGASVNVKDSIVRLTVGPSATATSNQVGIFADGNATCAITAENVVVLKYKVESAVSTNSDMLCGRSTNLTNVAFTNVHYVTEDCALASTITGVSAVAKASVNASWMSETLKLSTTLWEADTNKIIKLKLASANTPSAGATVNKLVLVTATVEKQFFKGNAFVHTGLLVTAIYTDGCVIVLDDYTVKVLNSSNEEITVEDFLTAAVGKYTVEVSKELIKETYTIFIVEETGIEVKDEFTQKAYVINSKFDATGLVVFANISDGSHILLTSKDYTITIKDSNNTVVTELNTAQKYTVEIRRGSFVKTYEIQAYTLLEEIEDIVDVYVDATVSTPLTGGKLYFKTINDALNYLKSLELDPQVIKNIHLAEGKYTEKITIDMANVHLVGDPTDYTKVIITYSAASGTDVLDGTGTYGTDDSATVIIKSSAINFTALHIFFKNEFDYNGSTFANKQALAVRCDADKAIFYQCGFTSYQDTLEAKMGRQYYYECYIAGAVDFIFGNNATAVFEGCTIKALTRYSGGVADNNNGYVCAPKGLSTSAEKDKVKYNYVFLNCDFTSEATVLDGSMSIARPWAAEAGVALLSCTFNEAYSKLGYDGSVKSRYFDMSGNSPLNAHFYEYNSKGVGAITEAVAGVTILTLEEANAYTLINIFKAVNELVTYEGGDWILPTDPKTLAEDFYIVYYELGQVEYNEGDTYVPSNIKIYHVQGNGFNGYTSTLFTGAVEKVYDELDAEVTSINALAKAGVYTVKLIIGEVVYAEAQFEVKESGSITITKELKASDIAESSVARGTTYLEGLFTVYGKTDGSAISVSTCNVTDGVDTYTKTIKLTGGTAKANVNEANLANIIKIVVEKAGTIKLVASQKNAQTATKETFLKLFGTDAVEISTSTVALSATDAATMSTVTFEISEAGTYYIGASADGFQLYSVAWIYEEVKPEIVEVVKELKASDIAESSVARGTTYLEGLFTLYGKTDGTAISLGEYNVTDGTNTYTKTIKLSGGKATASTNEAGLGNVIKIVVDKAGTIKLVASQKVTQSAVQDVFLKLFGSDAAEISSSTVLCGTDAPAMSIITFEISAAGTYYIGANSTGFHLYSAAWITR